MNFERGKDPIEALDLGLRPIKLFSIGVEVVIENSNRNQKKYDMSLRRRKKEIDAIKFMQKSEISYKEFFKIFSPKTDEARSKILEAVEGQTGPEKIGVLTVGYDDNIRYNYQNNDDYKEVFVRFELHTEELNDDIKDSAIKAVDFKGEIIPIRIGTFRLVK